MTMTVPTDSVATTTGAGLLAMAADLLPTVVGDGPMLSSDVHATLYSAARVLPGGDDRGRAHLVADQAEEMFAAYLVAAGETGPARSPRHTVRGWVTGSPMWAVARGLRAAARYFWRPGAHQPL
ncbi:MAG TPA: hypothetical protein VGJ07_00730 [Rugosimonospora sp.]